MTNRTPPSFHSIASILDPIMRNVEHRVLVNRIVGALLYYGMDLSDEARALQLLIVDRAVEGNWKEIEASFDEALDLARKFVDNRTQRT